MDLKLSNRKLMVLLSLLSLGIISLIAVIKYRSQGVEVLLINDGLRPIKQVKIVFTGGTSYIPQLSSKSQYKIYVNPTSESHLNVEFVDSNGLSHREMVDVYFERNYRGKIIIKIDDKGRTNWVDDVKLGTS